MNKTRQCGSCLHLNLEKAFEAPCSSLGMLPTSAPCNSFKANLHQLSQPEETFNDLDLFGSVLSKMSASQLAIFCELVSRERITRKYGYRFFQRVYVRYVGASSSNYLSNFMSARVLDCDAQHIRLIGDNDYHAYILLEHVKGKTSSLFVEKDFNALRKELIASKKFVDPQLKKTGKLLPASAKGQIANLDAAVPEHVDIRRQGMKKKQSADDLVSMVGRMNTGMYGTREARRATEVEVNWVV